MNFFDAEFLNTPAGNDMKKLLNFGEVIPNVVGSINPDRTVNIDEVISFSLTGNPIRNETNNPSPFDL